MKPAPSRLAGSAKPARSRRDGRGRLVLNRRDGNGKPESSLLVGRGRLARSRPVGRGRLYPFTPLVSSALSVLEKLEIRVDFLREFKLTRYLSAGLDQFGALWGHGTSEACYDESTHCGQLIAEFELVTEKRIRI